MGLFSRDKPKTFGKDDSFTITDKGTRRMQSQMGDDNHDIRVLMALETLGTSARVSTISEHSGLNRSQVESILPRLIRTGQVEPMNFDSEDEY